LGVLCKYNINPILGNADYVSKSGLYIFKRNKDVLYEAPDVLIRRLQKKDITLPHALNGLLETKFVEIKGVTHNLATPQLNYGKDNGLRNAVILLASIGVLEDSPLEKCARKPDYGWLQCPCNSKTGIFHNGLQYAKFVNDLYTLT